MKQNQAAKDIGKSEGNMKQKQKMKILLIKMTLVLGVLVTPFSVFAAENSKPHYHTVYIDSHAASPVQVIWS